MVLCGSTVWDHGSARHEDCLWYSKHITDCFGLCVRMTRTHILSKDFCFPLGTGHVETSDPLLAGLSSVKRHHHKKPVTHILEMNWTSNNGNIHTNHCDLYWFIKRIQFIWVFFRCPWYCYVTLKGHFIQCIRLKKRQITSCKQLGRRKTSASIGLKLTFKMMNIMMSLHLSRQSSKQ